MKYTFVKSHSGARGKILAEPPCIENFWIFLLKMAHFWCTLQGGPKNGYPVLFLG